jgi:hypothetical protein
MDLQSIDMIVNSYIGNFPTINQAEISIIKHEISDGSFTELKEIATLFLGVPLGNYGKKQGKRITNAYCFADRKGIGAKRMVTAGLSGQTWKA